IPIPEGIIESGEIKNEDAFVARCAAWVKRERKKLPSRHIAASLPEEKAFIRIIQLPKVKRDAIGDAVQWEIEANIPLSKEEIFYDYEIIEPIENSLDHFDVMITAFPKVIVESYARALVRSGCIPAILELESQAIVRSVAPELRDRKALIIVDIGRIRTSLIVFVGGAIIFTSTFMLGGRDFEKNIMKELDTDEEKARAIKISYGLDKKEFGGELFASLAPAISAMSDEIKRAVEFYKEHAKHRHGAAEEISEVLLVGGDANLLGLTSYLSSTLMIPVKTADVFVRFAKSGVRFIPPLTKNQSLEYATAIGLALQK
ncbi:MAG: type IV pilus assembly protein PilM, partial [Candidatus Colwellbacteria bacterium]|nr:type IV pilus assembly protein PilM [Candidatus Colwellbacteria bacterium]